MDNNGSINIIDAILLSRWLLEKQRFEFKYWYTADINNDGTINAVDLTLLKQQLLTKN